MQGICKFGFYELFKNVYSGIIGEENSYLYRTYLYLVASASAEFFADIALSPMESAKVKKSIFKYYEKAKVSLTPCLMKNVAYLTNFNYIYK